MGPGFGSGTGLGPGLVAHTWMWPSACVVEAASSPSATATHLVRRRVRVTVGARAGARARAGVRFRPARQTGTGVSSCVHSAGRTCSARQERAPTPEQMVDNISDGERERERARCGVRVVKQQATRCGAHLLARRLGAELPGAEPATQARRHDEVSAAPEHRDRRGAELERRCCRRCCHRVRASTPRATPRSVGDGEQDAEHFVSPFLPRAQHPPLNNSRYSQITSAHAPHHEHMNAHGHTADTHGSCARLRAAPAACEDEYDPDGEDQAEPLEGEPLLRVRVRARARARLRVSTRRTGSRVTIGGLELGGWG